jgi:tetratricopeptide (TPR) repeat protein
MTQDAKTKNEALTQKIEMLQKELFNNPRSLSFPLLADLYLTQEMFDEAYDLLEQGLKYHPQSVSGMIVLSKVLKHRQQLETAETILNRAIQLAPQNWQAYLLRAENYVLRKLNKKALADFKRVLAFNPTHTVALKAVPKLEMLAADESDESDLSDTHEEYEKNYSIQKLQQINHRPERIPAENTHLDETSNLEDYAVPAKLERLISLIDAFISRQDHEKAIKLLHECKTEFGSHYEITSRLLRLSSFEDAEKIRPKSDQKMSASKQFLILEKKQKALEILLHRINELKSTRQMPV